VSARFASSGRVRVVSTAVNRRAQAGIKKFFRHGKRESEGNYLGNDSR